MLLNVHNKNGEKLEVLSEGALIESAGKILVMTHGFGTSLHERGLNDEIVKYLLKNNGDLNVVRFSWSGFGESEGLQWESSPLKVKDDLLCVLRYVYENIANSAKVLTHGFSMGNIAMSRAIVELEGDLDIALAIYTNPSSFTDPDKLREKWANKAGSYVDENNITHIPRADGTVTRIGDIFWSDFNEFSYRDDLIKAIDTVDSILLRAIDDDIVNNSVLTELKFKRIISIHGNHNFSEPKDRFLFLGELNQLIVNI